jgi:hypothetical protein
MLYLNKKVHAFKNKMLNLFGEVENHGIRNCKLHVTINIENKQLHCFMWQNMSCNALRVVFKLYKTVSHLFGSVFSPQTSYTVWSGLNKVGYTV